MKPELLLFAIPIIIVLLSYIISELYWRNKNKKTKNHENIKIGMEAPLSLLEIIEENLPVCTIHSKYNDLSPEKKISILKLLYQWVESEIKNLTK